MPRRRSLPPIKELSEMRDGASRDEFEQSVSEPGKSSPAKSVDYEHDASRASGQEQPPRPSADYLDAESRPRPEEASFPVVTEMEEEFIIRLPSIQELRDRVRRENPPPGHAIWKLLGEKRDSVEFHLPPPRRIRPRRSGRQIAMFLLLSCLWSR